MFSTTIKTRYNSASIPLTYYICTNMFVSRNDFPVPNQTCTNSESKITQTGTDTNTVLQTLKGHKGQKRSLLKVERTCKSPQHGQLGPSIRILKAWTQAGEGRSED